MRRASEPSRPEVVVAYQDAHLLVLLKPPGLPTTAPDEHTECLTTRARAIDPKAPRMHATSRLDRDVTGLVTFARTDRAIAALLEARKAGRYARTYLALVRGVPPSSEDAWAWPIALDPRDKRLRVAVGAEGPWGPQRGPLERMQAARSRHRVLAEVQGHALLALFPETGRTHQLRVHCTAAGHPILGDGSYGGASRAVLPDGRVVAARRPLLHCARVALPRIEAAGMLELRASPPDDFVRAWTGLGGAVEALGEAPAGPV